MPQRHYDCEMIIKQAFKFENEDIDFNLKTDILGVWHIFTMNTNYMKNS